MSLGCNESNRNLLKASDETMQKLLKQIHKSPLTGQQKRTLKGQVLAGDVEGARKGFEKLMGRVRANG